MSVWRLTAVDVDAHRFGGDDLVDVLEFRDARHADDHLAQQFGFEHRDAVADGEHDVLVAAVFLDDGRFLEGLAKTLHTERSGTTTKG
jgi:hypothetical protein